MFLLRSFLELALCPGLWRMERRIAEGVGKLLLPQEQFVQATGPSIHKQEAFDIGTLSPPIPFLTGGHKATLTGRFPQVTQMPPNIGNTTKKRKKWRLFKPQTGKPTLGRVCSHSPKKSADPFLQRGGAWEGLVFVLVLVMIIITADVG